VRHEFLLVGIDCSDVHRPRRAFASAFEARRRIQEVPAVWQPGRPEVVDFAPRGVEARHRNWHASIGRYAEDSRIVLSKENRAVAMPDRWGGHGGWTDRTCGPACDVDLLELSFTGCEETDEPAVGRPERRLSSIGKRSWGE